MGWNDGSRISPYVSSKGFVKFIQPEYYDPKNEKTYTGYVALRLTCRTDIYIGSGFSVMPENSNQLVYQTMLYDGKPVIPGSSLKGVVRNIASAASNGCLPQLPRSKGGSPARYPRGINNIKCSSKNGFCIVCDMFGAMSKGSKVIFSDMYSENAKTEIKKYNAQYGPKAVYTENDGTAKGYKFYYTGDNKYEMQSKVNVQVVKKGAVFTGKVFFKKLTEEQLSLLMFSLGLDDSKDNTIALKIGGFKNEGIGEVQVTCIKFECSGNMNKTPSELAYNYYDMDTANKDGIDEICNILMLQ